MQAPTELHPALRTGWHFAERVRQELREVIRPLTAVQWIFRHEARSWCIGEVVEHLLRAEIGSSKMVRKLIRGDYQSRVFPVGATLCTADLDRYPYGNLTAPRDLVPGPLAAKAELEHELALAHSRFQLELERLSGDDPEALRSPDPATGIWFTLGGWVKLQAWHEAHHIVQIQRIAASSRFPR